jgi:hypothetical protein
VIPEAPLTPEDTKRLHAPLPIAISSVFCLYSTAFAFRGALVGSEAPPEPRIRAAVWFARGGEIATVAFACLVVHARVAYGNLFWGQPSGDLHAAYPGCTTRCRSMRCWMRSEKSSRHHRLCLEQEEIDPMHASVRRAGTLANSD